MNPVKGEAPLSLSDGRRLTLVLDMEALVEAEAAYGKPLPRLMAEAAQGFVGAVAALLQGALAQHNPLSRAEVLELVRSDGAAVQAALGEASARAFPDAKAEAGGNGAPAAAPAKPRAGKRSGSNGAKPG